MGVWAVSSMGSAGRNGTSRCDRGGRQSEVGGEWIYRQQGEPHDPAVAVTRPRLAGRASGQPRLARRGLLPRKPRRRPGAIGSRAAGSCGDAQTKPLCASRLLATLCGEGSSVQCQILYLVQSRNVKTFELKTWHSKLLVLAKMMANA